MSTTQTITLNITEAELTEAQGGINMDPAATRRRITVECPAEYDPEQITAEDVIHDGAITVVS